MTNYLSMKQSVRGLVFISLVGLLYWSTTPVEARYNASPFHRTLPQGISYIREDRIGSIRLASQAYSMPIYRINGGQVKLVKVTNRYSRRTEYWPVPSQAVGARGSDGNLAVIDAKNNKLYELWQPHWTNGRIVTGGMKSYPLNGSGISDSNRQVVSASGFAVTSGMILREDFLSGGRLDPNRPIHHALTMALPHQLLARNAFTGLAIHGDAASDNTGDIPLGRLYALPKSLQVDHLKVHPLTKAIARAIRDYGVYVNDRAGTSRYRGKDVGSIKIEPGLTNKLYGVNSDSLINTVRDEMAQIIAAHGLYQVSR